MMSAVVKPHQWDHGAYKKMVEAGVFPPDSHAELTHGKITDMSPLETAHCTALSLLEEILRNAFGKGHIVRTQQAFIANAELTVADFLP